MLENFQMDLFNITGGPVHPLYPFQADRVTGLKWLEMA